MDKISNNISKNKYLLKENRLEEFGGFKGQEPTKYGDWQHKGRVTDF
jgi:hypothetical protein